MEDGHQAEPLLSTRGAFIKRMVAAGFAMPMIGSFGFSELASAACAPKHHMPNQSGKGDDSSGSQLPPPVLRPPVDESHQDYGGSFGQPSVRPPRQDGGGGGNGSWGH